MGFAGITFFNNFRNGCVIDIFPGGNFGDFKIIDHQ